ncbi:MAG: hypothetical protein K5920_08875 [Bacteroidales bacterium]|nr:hypothetical protein [Bacteroidales bacterium]
MKKTTLLRILAIFTFVFTMSFLTQAQTSFSCGTRTTCLLDENAEIENCSEKHESSLFVFNDDITMITHTTETNKTVYYIKESDYDDSDNSFTFEVTSENGNDYVFFVFPDEEQIAVYFEDEGDSYVVIFEIKSIF